MKKIITCLLASAAIALAQDNNGNSGNSNSGATVTQNHGGSGGTATANANNNNTFNPANVNANTFRPVSRNRNQNTNKNANLNKNTNKQAQAQNQSQSSSNFNNNTAKGGNAVATGGAASSRNALVSNPVAVAPTSINNVSATVTPDVTVNTDYVEWKKFQLYGRKDSRSTPATISKQDIRSVKPVTAYAEPTTSKDRYNAFLRAQGVTPNTVGHSTLLPNGKMYVPTTYEQYSK